MAGLQEDNKKILTELVQRQMLVLGPNIALDTARKVVGLRFSENGTALEISGDFEMVLKALIHEYQVLSEAAIRQTLDWLKAKYPAIKFL